MFSLDEILFDEEPHTYTFRGKRYESVTQAIRLAGLGDDFSHVPQDRMEYAQRRGRMVHLACQYYDEGDLNLASVHETIKGYVEAYVKFRQERPLKVVAVEQKMVNVDHRLAGTPDLICFINGRRSVIDRKSSQYMSKSMGLQTAGYKWLWNWNNAKTPIHDRYGLRLEKNGKFKLIPHEDPDDEPAFIDVLHDALSEANMLKWREKYVRAGKPRQLQSGPGEAVGPIMGMGGI